MGFCIGSGAAASLGSGASGGSGAVVGSGNSSGVAVGSGCGVVVVLWLGFWCSRGLWLQTKVDNARIQTCSQNRQSSGAAVSLGLNSC